MDTKLLRNFLVIVEAGSLSKAAERLHVAQPALSHQLGVLEAAFGTPLLFRTFRGVQPTKAGAVLCQHAHEVLLQMERLRMAVRHGGVTEAGPVAVGFPTSVVGPLASALVSRTLERYPAIRLRIFESMSGYVADRLVGGRLDLALLFRDEPTTGVIVEPLLTEQLFIMGRAGLDDVPLDRPISLSCLGGVPLVLPSEAQGLRMLIERSFVRNSISLNVISDIDSLPLLVETVRAGHACTILSKSALIAHGGEKDMEIREIVSPGIRRPVSICWSVNLPRTAATEAVHRLIVGLVRETVVEGKWAGAALQPASLRAERRN